MKTICGDTRTLVRRIGLALGIALLYGCGASSPPAQPAQPAQSAQPASFAAPVPPAVSINAVMVAWIDHSGHEMWDVEKPGMAPKNDADWRRLERHAIQLAAAGTMISLGGAGEYDNEWAHRAAWAPHAQALTHAAMNSLNAVRARNFEQLVRANGELTDTCEGCHAEFKPSLPTEGIVHQPY